MAKSRFCKFFQRGSCRVGSTCTYVHEKDPDFKPRACQHFMRGRCRYGDICNFSHKTEDVDFLKAANGLTNSSGNNGTDHEHDFRTFRCMVPKSTSRTTPLPEFQRIQFFQKAYQCVCHDVETMQEVVELLTSEGGLLRIDELLAIPILDYATTQLNRFLTDQLLPFFRICTHRNVTTSIMLRASVLTLFNVLYKSDGTGERATTMFTRLSKHFADFGLVHNGDLEDEALDAFKTFMMVLSKLLEVNTLAHTNPAFLPIAEACASVLENATAAHCAPAIASAKKDLSRIQQRLGIAQSLSNVPQNQQIVRDRAVFRLNHDSPGELSADGKRHDNDQISIKDILIMPTMQEIESSRNEYLPLADPREWHLSGIAGLVDRHFRLLREDTIGQLRDAVKIELAKLRNQSGRPQQHGQHGSHTHVYRGVQVRDVVLDESFGLQVVLGFEHPQSVAELPLKKRETWWTQSKRLQSDSLICLLSPEGTATFMTVAPTRTSPSQLQERYSLTSDVNRAHIIATFVSDKDFCNLSDLWPHAGESGDLSVVEFPGILLPAFVPTLQAMQRMSASLELPFSDILAPYRPCAESRDAIHTMPPLYAVRQGFRFDLSIITTENRELFFTPGEDIDAASANLHQSSQLDEAQARAVLYSLSHSISCIQGPPGTGKSFTGVNLVRVQLHNKLRSEIGPIVIVTFTNHALDQVLERLHESGVKNIVRIGSRSKSELLQDCNLREVAKRLDLTKTEKSRRWTATDKVKKEAAAIDRILNDLRKVHGESAMKYYLLRHYPRHHNELFLRQLDKDGFETVRHDRASILKSWLRSGHRGQASERDLTDLYHADLYTMSHAERKRLYHAWCADSLQQLQDKLDISLAMYNSHKTMLKSIRTELDLRVLRQANIIGLTTSGLARNLDLLHGVDAKVLICEEAGEVVEAHMLTALLPSVEHVILIGDHQQLRPQVQNHALSMESKNGAQYALDMSLFERLVKPTDGFTSAIHCSTLQTQRRMHPCISRLVRETQYPSLQDGGLVASYPEVAGMRKRLFWMHHDHTEDGASDFVQTTSHTNQFEVEMTAALVQHISQQGVYKSDEIAVITPYLGQLRAIRNKLQRTHAIVLNDRDVADLEKEPDESDPLLPNLDTAVAKGSLIQTLRIATVDNFQGEEAKVVIISLVRSNAKNKPGFLKTPNRINVLLSRAQHGMYIIGNAHTTKSVPMWSDVVNMLEQNGNFGEAFELCCPRHPDTDLLVSKPADFLRLAPEAGCDRSCDKRLQCGHACVAKCHSDMMHAAVYCTKPCTRLMTDCEHPCPKLCGERCDKLCKTMIDGLHTVLDCGHVKTSLPCHEYQHPESIRCQELVDRTVPGCEHVLLNPCYVDFDSDGFSCTATCSKQLPCGHTCRKACHECNTREDRQLIGEDHGKCQQPCDRSYSTCKHSCKKPCHPDTPCGLCRQPCDNRCAHAACDKICSEACTPCMEADCCSGRDCPHQEPCSMPCAAPCDWLPCSLRCQKKLSCGCQCPSVCGEVCPEQKFCQTCCSEDIKAQQADLLLFTPYGEINLDSEPCLFAPCGHIFTLASLDGTIGMSEHYGIDPQTHKIVDLVGCSEPFTSKNVELKRCPECRASLRTVGRYGRIVRRALLDESTKKLTAWSNAMHERLTVSLVNIEANLLDSLDEYNGPYQDITLRGNIGGLLNAVKKLPNRNRYSGLLKLISKVYNVTQQISKEEQPYQRVHDMVEHARQTTNTTSRQHRLTSQEVQPREHLQSRNLWLRSIHLLVSDIVNLHKRGPVKPAKGILVVDLTEARELCNQLAQEATASSSILQEAEALLLWAKFAALECSIGSGHDGHDLTEQASERLATIETICEQQIALRNERRQPQAEQSYPSQQTPIDNLAKEAQEVRRMLREGVSDTEMRMVVSAMAKEFSGTGHWYRCVNGHPFTVGECGMPMELATCPECGQGVGGRDHTATAGVSHARDIEERFGSLQIS